MKKKKKSEGYKTIDSSCACCYHCKVWIEGPRRGTCASGGPFNGYYIENTGETKTKTDLHLQRKKVL